MDKTREFKYTEYYSVGDCKTKSNNGDHHGTEAFGVRILTDKSHGLTGLTLLSTTITVFSTTAHFTHGISVVLFTFYEFLSQQH